ncbi:Ig-like domain-containing protein [Paludisphaera soli]|uniref:Ig-like domain-containing protein n=1 Tax=Paludisphaera soli TaxID=2712865 RepID=UPI0013E99EC6|nr:Ig-like domain-containing protein [Paludisphaera soli]
MDRPRVTWGSWNRGEAAGRRKRRLRGETLRRLETLEHRTLLAAAINIDAAAFLTYDTDVLTSEILTVSVSGNVYTFASDVPINVVSNAAGLTVGGDGSMTVTVQAITGLQVDVNTGTSTLTVASTNVPTGITLFDNGNEVTLGSASNPTGLAALSSAVAVSESGAPTGNQVVLDDSGAAPVSVTYTVTAADVARGGFGGLSYSGVDELTLKGASTLAGGSNTYEVSGTADGTWTWLDDSTSSASSVFTVTGTSAVQDELTGLRLSGGGETSIFTVAAAATRVDVWAGTGTNLLLVSNLESASGVTGDVSVLNGASAPFQVTLDHSAGTADGVWNLEMATVGEFFLAHLTGFSAGGSLNYGPDEVDVVTLRNGEDLTASLTVDFAGGNPLPVGSPLVYEGGRVGAATAASDLILVGDPEVGIVAQRHMPSGPGTGQIQFTDEDDGATEILYSQLASDSIYDTLAAASYTFVYTGDPGVGVEVLTGANSALTGNVQTLLIASAGAPPEFVDTHLGNKATIVVDQTAGGSDYSTLVDYSGATPVAGLASLSVVTGSGDDEARLVDLPPGAAFILQQGAGSDTASLTLAGAGASSTALDGGPGVDALTIIADGFPLSAADFSAAGGTTTITSALLPGGPISYTRYESVVVTGADPIVPTVYGVPIHAVEGQRLVDGLVGAFTASATARASDFVATVAWGDGTTTAGVIVQDASNPSIYYIYGSHTYYEPGQGLATAITVASLGSTTTTYIGGVPVTFVASAGAPVTTPSQAFVDDAPITVAVNNVWGFENIPIATGPLVVATFNDVGGIDPTDAAPASNYSATIYWGDGSAGVGGLTIIRNGTTSSFVVTAAPHTYAIPGSYVVTVVVTDLETGSAWIGTSTAAVADAPLTRTPSQPSVANAQEGIQFVDRVIGSFVDANPLATTDQYTVTIDWGDGSPTSLGRVIQPGGVGTTMFVVGTHTYADALAPGAPPLTAGAGPVAGPVTLNGTYRLTMAVRDTFGSTVNLFNELTVEDRPLTIAGALDSTSDTGISNTDNVTNDATPTYSGVASEGGAVVYLYASLNGGTPVLIGSSTADATGAWSVTPALALADGGYRIQVQAYDDSGHTIGALTTLTASLVIDTVGPKVTDLVFDNFRGQVIASFEDFGGAANVGVGLVQAALRDANNFRFAKLAAANSPVRRFLATSISVSPGTNLGEQVATVRFNDGAGIRGGRYLFTARSVDPANLSGIRDVAGNALDGEYYGYFPSGNDVNGGDFEARLDARHHTIFPPRTQVGTATPVDPPGRPATGRFLRLDGTLLPSAGSAVRLSSARGAARLARLGS